VWLGRLGLGAKRVNAAVPHAAPPWGTPADEKSVSYHVSRCSPQTSADTDRLAMSTCTGAPEGGRDQPSRY